jgi:hypothetical protein
VFNSPILPRYVAEQLSSDLEPMYRQFARVFDAFRPPPPETDAAAVVVPTPEPARPVDLKKVPKLNDDYEDDDDDEVSCTVLAPPNVALFQMWRLVFFFVLFLIILCFK